MDVHVAAAHLAVVGEAGHGSGREREDLLEVACGQRQFANLLLPDHAPDGGGSSLNKRNFGRYIQGDGVPASKGEGWRGLSVASVTRIVHR